MSLEGVLSDFGVGEIFQLIGQQRKTGILEIKREAVAFEVCFVEGQVVRARPVEQRQDGALASFLLRTGILSDVALAEARREQEQTLSPLEDILLGQEVVDKEELEQISLLLTDETIFELFLWDEGRFAFRPAETVDERLGDRLRGAEGVLLDALRMKDEWSQIEDALPDFSGIPVLKLGLDELAGPLEAASQATSVPSHLLERLCRLADGRLSLRRVLDLSRAGTFEAARGLMVLIAHNVLRVEQPRPAVPEEATGADRREQLRILVPYAPLLALPLAAALLLAGAPRPSSYPLAYDPVAQARDRSEMQELQVALEVHRWMGGEYPNSLQELQAGFASRLASLPLARYSYERSRGGYHLAHESGRAVRVRAESRSDPGPADPS